jgi:YgiT-type zinc finger domain-containing protein
MICPDCRGTVFEHGLYTMAQVVGGEPFVLRHVPADRCRQCGYDVISLNTARQLDEALDAPARGVMGVPVYDLAVRVLPKWDIFADGELAGSTNGVPEFRTVPLAGTAGVAQAP